MRTLITSPRRTLFLLGALLFAVLSISAASARAQVPEQQVPTELRAAIKTAVEARGKTYAGLCQEIEPHKYPGQWCAGVQSLTATQAQVFAGAVLTDELQSITFVKSGNAWVVAGSTPNPSPTPGLPVPTELRAAIKASVEARGKTYAGLCQEIEPHKYPGQWCAGVQSLTVTQAQVFVGAVLTDELQSILFVKSGNTWVAASSTPNPSPTPDPAVPIELRAAIKAVVEARGKTYAGLCREIDQTKHVGQWCGFVQSLTPTRAEVTFGPVLSNEIHSVTFTKSGNIWIRAGGVLPPNTGDAGLLKEEPAD